MTPVRLPISLSRPAETGSIALIDGDTIQVRGVRIHPHGFAAPETGETCRVSGLAWQRGTVADRVSEPGCRVPVEVRSLSPWPA